jgi:SAM-dependent methyltransferase
VGEHLRGQPAAAGPVCSCSPDRPPARPAAPPRRPQGPGCRLWDGSAAAAGTTAVSPGRACRCRPGQGNAGRGHGSDPTELRIHYLRAGAEHLPFTEEVFDLVVAIMSLRHWTDRAAGIAEIGRVLTPGGVLVLADVFPSSRRPTLMGSLLLRRRRPTLPEQLDAALTAHRLAVLGCHHTPWFSLPDAQVVAAQRQSAPRVPRGEWCGRAVRGTSCG